MEYRLEFNGGGEPIKGSFDTDRAAIMWVESTLATRGYDAANIVSADWNADGQNDDGHCYRMLFWACETDAANDPGTNSVCALCVVR